MSQTSILIKQLMQALDEYKALNIILIDVSQHTAITDFMIICSGRSSRHVQAISELTIEHLKKSHIKSYSISGFELGEWVLVDFGAVLLHVMQEEARAFYNLESLWGQD